jgi:hypothetical protein
MVQTKLQWPTLDQFVLSRYQRPHSMYAVRATSTVLMAVMEKDKVERRILVYSRTKQLNCRMNQA